MQKPFIPLILGTGRQGRESEKVANYVFGKMQKQSIETELIDVRDFATLFTVPPWEENPATKKWRDIAARADAFVLVFPEYNHGYPGELKMLLDQAQKEYFHKPVLLCSVSSGAFGGVRAADHLLPVLRDLKLTPLKESLIFPQVKTLFAKSKSELDELYEKKFADAMGMLLAYAESLRTLREGLTKT
jgi:NAD(P)H-dependent FMN reductase